MNQYIICRVDPGRQYRVGIEAWDGRNMCEVKTENRNSCDDSNGIRDPHSFYFANTVEECELAASALAYWNPGTTWQWFQVGGIVSSKRPGEKPVIKKISDKGYLPEDMAL